MFIVSIPSPPLPPCDFPFIFSESGKVVDLRGVPLPVSTVRVGDSLVNRRTFTLTCGRGIGYTSNFQGALDADQFLN